LLAAVVTGLLFVWILTKSPLLRQIAQKAPMQLPEASNTQDVGNLLYGQYMLSFEIASLLLLVAIVGAVVMAKKRI
jgi:NADH-quinone oxidoreductase subunit J